MVIGARKLRSLSRRRAAGIIGDGRRLPSAAVTMGHLALKRAIRHTEELRQQSAAAGHEVRYLLGHLLLRSRPGQRSSRSETQAPGAPSTAVLIRSALARAT